MLSDAERRRTYDAYGHEGLKTGGYAPQLRGLRLDLATCSARSSARAGSTPRSAGRRTRGGADAGRRRRASRSRSTLAEAAHGTRVEVSYDATALCETCHGNGAEPGTPIVDLPDAATAPARSRRVAAHRASASSCAPRSATTAAATAGSPSARATPATGAGWSSRRGSVEVDVPAGIADGQRIRDHRPRPRRRARRPERRPLRGRARRARTSASCATREDLITVVDVAAPLAALGTTIQVPTLDGDVPGRGPGRHAAGRDDRAARPRHAAARPRPHRRPARGRQRRDPAPADAPSSATCSSSSRAR